MVEEKHELFPYLNKDCKGVPGNTSHVNSYKSTQLHLISLIEQCNISTEAT